MRFYTVELMYDRSEENSKRVIKNLNLDYLPDDEIERLKKDLSEVSSILSRTEFRKCIQDDIDGSIYGNNDSLVNVNFIDDDPIEIAISYMDLHMNIEDIVSKLLKSFRITFKIGGIKEIGISSYVRALNRSVRHMDNRIDFDQIFDKLCTKNPYQREFYSNYTERRMNLDKTNDEILECSDSNFLGSIFKQEVQRIINNKNTKFLCQPCSYLLTSDSSYYLYSFRRNLLNALHNKGRILSSIYLEVDLCDRPDYEQLEFIYQALEGGTIVLKMNDNILVKGDTMTCEYDLKAVANIVKKFGEKTLTIFELNTKLNTVKEFVQNTLIGLVLVEIHEENLTIDQAKRYLTNLIIKDELDVDENFLKQIENSNRTYDKAQLDDIYSKWKKQTVNTLIYPEYSPFERKEEATTSEYSNAYKELQDLIGLENVKKTIKSIIDYFKMQKEYLARGIKFKRPSMHMCFTGNPGTCKTTVARLLARVLKENDVLKIGTFLEVGRADLVAEFVGQTAPKVKSVFEKAKGGVLFIDEAYSLIEDRKGLFGYEAINTIVQEMENNRESTLVIFAGYKEEMESFLNRNPGLSSRIAFHVDFEDYSEIDLLNIFKYLSSNDGFKVDSEGKEKLLKIFKEARKRENFGNGRFARNLFEKGKLKLAERVSSRDLNFVSDEELITFTKDDFEDVSILNEEKTFGFVA